ncbi:helix-turn-helix transcriptional regulator [Actinoplanes sp. CA-142083]|uniref:helix-turn-helix transcriptional regulator n=1 Tax=Actinoplanes sp. CA-142083 TaxID=3239903 RepID=UPI003D8ECEE3
MELAYAGLHQLCAPLLDLRDRRPPLQSEALAVAFGDRAGSPPDRFLVGMAVLNLLAEAAEEQPVLCVIDDGQWLDQASVQTLTFASRRLVAERVGVFFAVRDPESTPAWRGPAELPVAGLADEDARALLDATVPGRLDERVRDRIVSETRGNPLACRPPGARRPRPPGWSARPAGRRVAVGSRPQLAATGEVTADRATRAHDSLTPQEANIAGLAGSGLTNAGIGARLFLSPHTVEWHMRKIFTKLAITSRRQLRPADGT